MVNDLVRFLDAGKAREICHVDLRGKSSVADFMIIASGDSQRFLQALTQKLLWHLKERYRIRAQAEGDHSETGWALIDAGDVIVHLFKPDVREKYNLEAMWKHPMAEAHTHPLAV